MRIKDREISIESSRNVPKVPIKPKYPRKFKCRGIGSKVITDCLKRNWSKTPKKKRVIRGRLLTFSKLFNEPHLLYTKYRIANAIMAIIVPITVTVNVTAFIA